VIGGRCLTGAPGCSSPTPIWVSAFQPRASHAQIQCASVIPPMPPGELRRDAGERGYLPDAIWPMYLAAACAGQWRTRPARVGLRAGTPFLRS
jgi:hypothetical protein